MTVKDDWVDGVDIVDDTALNAMGAAINTAVQGSASGTPTALTLWKGTQAQYDALSPDYDSNTVYICT